MQIETGGPISLWRSQIYVAQSLATAGLLQASLSSILAHRQNQKVPVRAFHYGSHESAVCQVLCKTAESG